MTELRRIGDIPVTLPGLGCNNFGRRLDEERSRAVVHEALDVGVALFDTADVYGEGRSEEYLGRALGSRRDEVVIVSKFGMLPPEGGPTGGDPRYIAEACERSLERLGTDRIDVYLLHRPDADTPIGETLAALNRLREQGKVREFGCSNFTAEQMQEAATAAAGLRGFATVQNMYSLVFREPETEVFPACERLGMSFMPYFPLASGVLTGKYRRGEPAPAGSRLGGSGGEPAEKVIDPNQLVAAERLGAFAEAHGHTLLELALSWLATRRGVATVIAGATSAEQVRANAAATTAWKLSHDQLAELDRLTKGD